MKSKAAMIQLHHIDGNQHIASRLLTKSLVHPSSDGSKHPIIKIKSRMKLGKTLNQGVGELSMIFRWKSNRYDKTKMDGQFIQMRDDVSATVWRRPG